MNRPPALEPVAEMLTLVTARVRDACVHAPLIVDAALDLLTVCREMSSCGLTAALVRDGERLGIFTTTDLRDALLRPLPPQQLAVREVAHFEIVEVQADADVFEALFLMARHRVHRLLVRDGTQLLGLLGQLDLVGFVANHSHLIALQIDQAASLAALQVAAQRSEALVELLHGSGIHIERIARLVTALNARLFARAWSLVAPPDLVARSCLLVMGSEGRGEQILKTDQDNALLLPDGVDFDGLPEVCARFSAALADFGYPPCPGGIMLVNPVWRQPLSGLRESMRQWVYGDDPEGPMRLAIFFDAVAVAGDGRLLAAARQHLAHILTGSDRFLAHFAAAADRFDAPGHWWTRLGGHRDEQPLDLKKLGTFPIVHGVRALSLQVGVDERGTVQRLERLVARGHVDAVLARDLVAALHGLMALRLSHQLRQRGGGALPGNLLQPSALGPLERATLRQSLDIVKRLRLFLRQHFRLDLL